MEKREMAWGGGNGALVGNRVEVEALHPPDEYSA